MSPGRTEISGRSLCRRLLVESNNIGGPVHSPDSLSVYDPPIKSLPGISPNFRMPGALYLNLLLFYFSNKILVFWETQKRV